MTFLMGVIIGLIGGWLVERGSDWFAAHRDEAALGEKLEAAEAEISHLRYQLAQDEQQLKRLASAEIEINELQAQLAETEALRAALTTAEITIDQLQTELAAQAGAPDRKQDQLKK